MLTLVLKFHFLSKTLPSLFSNFLSSSVKNTKDFFEKIEHGKTR